MWRPCSATWHLDAPVSNSWPGPLPADCCPDRAGQDQGIRSAAGKTIDTLERLGYVERGTDPRDARRKIVRLTDRGTECLASARIFDRLRADWAQAFGRYVRKRIATATRRRSTRRRRKALPIKGSDRQGRRPGSGDAGSAPARVRRRDRRRSEPVSSSRLTTTKRPYRDRRGTCRRPERGRCRRRTARRHQGRGRG
ncbi:MarR family winged helix-turn-helix transcriptional regulator [Streptomyces sp. NPDC006739]|uniref:MarR family winged helix-turn-helix transcriptional regulator n=1 Tax=Streptomyces sp. NPDC006739 TaxID=3364763 RepID=UPI003683DCF4